MQTQQIKLDMPEPNTCLGSNPGPATYCLVCLGFLIYKAGLLELSPLAVVMIRTDKINSSEQCLLNSKHSIVITYYNSHMR